MKKLFLLLLASFLFIHLDAQLIKRLGERAKQKMESKAGEKMDKGIDDAVDGKKKEKKIKKDSSETSASEAVVENTSAGSGAGESGAAPSAAPESTVPSSTTPSTLKAYSKYDFIPGEKILVYENFATDAIGDFPDKWNTNSSGEMVNLSGKEGKWFKITKMGIYYPEFITSLPENFTLEFDLGVNNGFNYYSTELVMNFANLKSPDDFNQYSYYSSHPTHTVRFAIHPSNTGGETGHSTLKSESKGGIIMDNGVNVKEFNSKSKNITHVAMWRQKQRLRVYVNNEKIWDVPKIFSATDVYNSLVFSTYNFYTEEDFYVLGNLRLAVGAPDTRNKFITEGKFVTRGILFDVNSDQIKPESYGTIKEIATVLNENAGVKVKIVGHTDSDGDDKTNMELSKKRAEAVKNTLIKEFGLDGARIETDGKGESQPVDKSETAVGKANNRRVEFIKL